MNGSAQIKHVSTGELQEERRTATEQEKKETGTFPSMLAAPDLLHAGFY